MLDQKTVQKEWLGIVFIQKKAFQELVTLITSTPYLVAYKGTFCIGFKYLLSNLDDELLSNSA